MNLRPIPMRRRGALAVVMVIVLVMISLIMVGFVVSGARDQDLTIRRLETLRAFYAAEAGLNMALREAIMISDADGDGGIGTISNDGNPANNPSFGAAGVWVEAAGSGLQATLISHGAAGQANRRLESTVEVPHAGQGLIASYFTSLTALSQTADVNWSATPSHTEVVSMMNFAAATGAGWPGGPTNNWGKRFAGRISIPQGGAWTFYTRSDDGSRLWINNTLVVNNDGLHSMQTLSGAITLSAGLHDIEVQWFERTGNFGLIVSWSGPGVPSSTPIPASAFSH